MKTKLLLLLLVCAAFALNACAPRVNDPAEMITVNKERELKLIGVWELTALRDGRNPQPQEKRTLTFLGDGTMKMDLWEHQLTYKYEAMPDPDHLRLTWVSSTNPNDKPGAVIVQAMVVTSDALTLDGDRFRRIASAGSATLTPPAVANAPTTIPQVNLPTSLPQATLPIPLTPKTVSARLGEPFVMHQGEVALLTDSTDQFGIQFWNVASDSRCPQHVTCVWAGELRVQLTFQKDGIAHPPILELTTNPGDPKHVLNIEGYLVEITDVQPPAGADKKIALQDYAVTFRVTHEVASPTSQPNVLTAALDQPITLKMFQTLRVPDPGFRATLNGVLEESRCPKSVNCVQAGRALISFLTELGDKIGYISLSTSPPDGRTIGFFKGYQVELLTVQPYPETPNVEIPAIQYSVTVVVHKNPPPTTVKKNQGFVLRVGEKATLADENVTVQFVRVLSDSRCPYNVACAVRGNAPLEVTLTEANGDVQTFLLNTDESQKNQRTPDFGSYAVELIALNPYPRADVAGKEITPDEYEATLVVHKFATPQGPAPTPTPVKPTACLGLTRATAAGILGEPVQELPLSDVVIKVREDDESFGQTFGICGFVSTATLRGDSFIANDPYELGHQSSHAITAARLSGGKVLELLRVAGIVRYANPDADVTPYLLLKTRIAAGDWDGLFQELPKLTDNKDVHFEAVDSYGDEGLWVWRSAAERNYAALLVRDQSSFVLVEALLNKNIGEDAARESLHTLMEQIIP